MRAEVHAPSLARARLLPACAFGAKAAQTRDRFRGTLAAGGGWNLRSPPRVGAWEEALLAWSYERSPPHGPEPDRLPPHRPRPHVPLQLALRAPAGRGVPAADREHGHEPRGRRGDRADSALAPLARHRMGRRRDLPARPAGALPGRGPPAGSGRKGLRGRGRHPFPHARRGRDHLGRPRARAIEFR